MRRRARALSMALSLAWLPGCVRSPIYYPTTTPAAVVERLAELHDARVEPIASRAIRLVGLRHPAVPDAAELLFFGGNAMSLVETSGVLAQLVQDRPWGWAVWAYRGYDGSQGTPKQDDLIADAGRQVRHLGARPQRLFLIGQSLGTGVAVYLAAALSRAGTPPAGVVLLSPYTSIRRVADEALGMPLGWLLADRWEALPQLVDVEAPVLIVHGAGDEVIDVAHGRAVAAALGERARLVVVADAGHNDLWLAAETAASIRSFVAEHAAPPPR